MFSKKADHAKLLPTLPDEWPNPFRAYMPEFDPELFDVERFVQSAYADSYATYCAALPPVLQRDYSKPIEVTDVTAQASSAWRSRNTSTHSILKGRGTQQYPLHQASGPCQLKLASTHTWETSATVRENAHALLGCISLPCVEAARS